MALKKRKTHLIFPLILLLWTTSLQAQEVAVKTNLLYDATATINAGVEVAIAPRWTLDISGNFNGWNQAHQRRIRRTNAVGNIGWHNLKHAIGFATLLPGISSGCTCMAANTTWADWTTISLFWEQTSPA